MIGLADEGAANGDSFFWSKRDLQEAVMVDRLRGIDVWLEHGDQTKECLAKVLYAWVDDNDGLYVLIKFDGSVRSRAVKAWVKNGLFQGLSLGYNTTYDKDYRVLQKDIFEISLVHRPYHKRCQVKSVFDGDDFDAFMAQSPLAPAVTCDQATEAWSRFFDT